MLEDAVPAYDLANKYSRVVELLNKLLLSQVISAPPISESNGTESSDSPSNNNAGGTRAWAYQEVVRPPPPCSCSWTPPFDLYRPTPTHSTTAGKSRFYLWKQSEVDNVSGFKLLDDSLDVISLTCCWRR